jgi:hypothetical protein
VIDQINEGIRLSFFPSQGIGQESLGLIHLMSRIGGSKFASFTRMGGKEDSTWKQASGYCQRPGEKPIVHGGSRSAG